MIFLFKFFLKSKADIFGEQNHLFNRVETLKYIL